MPRDSQRSKVYKAQNQINEGNRLETIPEIQNWVDKITASRWWKSRYPWIKRIKILPGRGCRNAKAINGVYPEERRQGFDAVIKLPCWARTELTILHEVTHIAVDPPLDGGHGREFCRNYLGMVGRWMSQQAQQELRQAFRANKVKWHPKRS
jgi:putative metallohydrolase (TIGR04338 family)